MSLLWTQQEARELRNLSQRIRISDNNPLSGDRMKEASSINASLSALGNVIVGLG